jgi:glycosyltransferase involved in cell wall biosynthesis
LTDARPGDSRPLRVLQVVPSDRMGGAEKIALSLHRAYRARGQDAWVATAKKTSGDAHTIAFDSDARRHPWARFWRAAASALGPVESARGVKRLQGLLRHHVGQPIRTLRRARGHEDFDFPATAELLRLPPEPPDVLQLHNLHSPSGFFDLRRLPALSHQFPTVITLHDAWLLAGHCAHSFDCDRWRTGCGQCPDLSIYPGIARDNTAANWRRKRDLLAASRLHVVTPSRWLMDKVEASIVRPAIVTARVIPNGVDLRTFRPADRAAARRDLGLPQDAKILLFAASGIRSNPFKDYPTLRAALARVAASWQGGPLLVLALGESEPDEQLSPTVTIRHLPFEPDETKVARHYQAADAYLHAARADTFPTTVLEALACGLPVIATSVGGIPEQVTEGETGYLTPPGDPVVFGDAVLSLLAAPDRMSRMSAAAVASARERFDLEKQAARYLDLYREVLATGR